MNFRVVFSTVLFFMTMCLFSPTTSKAKDTVIEENLPKVTEVTTYGYRMPDPPDKFENLLPNLDVAFQVAYPILRALYNTDFEEYNFKGYLANDSIWVIYGDLKRLTEGGGPYIELNKNDGRVMVITHTK